MTIPRALIVCADDFALHAEVSRAVLALAKQGRITATSAMVLSPRWPEDAQTLESVREHIDVGLHLDWTSAFARHAGHGTNLPAAMLTALAGGFNRVRAEAVIERQLDVFETHWGAPPNFIDGHQHVQQFAGIREALITQLQRRYQANDLPLPYLRVSRPPPETADLKARIIAALGADAMQSIAAHAGCTCANALLGTYGLHGDEATYRRRMQGWLQALPHRAILMCHPALGTWHGDTHGNSRLAEFRYLHGPEFAQDLQQTGVVLARGAVALAQAGSAS